MKNYKPNADVELAIKIVDGWHADSRNIDKSEPDGLKLARMVIQRGNEVALTPVQAAAPNLLEACKRAHALISLLTVHQVINAGGEAIQAAGLNPYCMNEGLADGTEPIYPSFLINAISLAEGR